jgi:hypothetical protein
MFPTNKKTTYNLIYASLAAILLTACTGHVAYADFTFGPLVNLESVVPALDPMHDTIECVSSDGLEMYLTSDRAGGRGSFDVWVLRRDSVESTWTGPTNLGSPVNGAAPDFGASLSADGLELYLTSYRAGGYGGRDLYVTTRETRNAPWGIPVNLGPKVNGSSDDGLARLSSNSLELYFQSNRSGGYGNYDLYVSRRATTSDPWGDPVNLGPTVNGVCDEALPSLSPDGLLLVFQEYGACRPGGYGGGDLWMTRRAGLSAPWDSPENLGPVVNGADFDAAPVISSDGSLLYFATGAGNYWQAPILPIVDFNGDGIVDATDECIMINHWGENYSLCDIGPMPWGDGIVDVKDLIVLAENMYGYIQPIAHWTLNETTGDIAYDKAGKNDALVYGDALWQPAEGKVGGSLILYGFDDYVSTSFILNPGNTSFSVTAWIKGGATGQVIISQADVEGQSAIESGSTWLGISQSNGGLMTGLMDIFFGPLESESVVTNDQWHHVGLVYDIVAMKRHLYLDGTEVAVDDGAVAGVQSSAGLYIGAGQTLDTGTFFSGMIDDVRIYNQALSAKQIAALAQ